MARRIFVDTEWTAPPWLPEAELMWVGLADELGQSWYGVSSDANIDPASNPFVSGVFELLAPDEQRLSRVELADRIVSFCGHVDEFWAWIPTLGKFAEWFHLPEREAQLVFERCWDVDLQMLRALISPWPSGWPTNLNDLNAAALSSNIEIPPRAPNHLHPRVHAEWNRLLFSRIHAARNGCDA